MKQLTLGNESIDFQSDALFKGITLIVTDMHAAGVTKGADMGPYLTRMDRCVYDVTGVNTLSNPWIGVDNAIVFVPNLTKGSVLNNTSFNKWLEKNFNADNIKFLDLKRKGWVDPKNSRVGGAFSEIVNRIYVGTEIALSKRYTPEEVAAAFIHEVGHAFTFLQKLADTVMVNHVLQRSWQELTSNNVDVTTHFILEKAAKDLEITNKSWIEPVTSDTSKEVAFRILVSAVQIEDRAMDNKRFFTQDAWEELADIFVARHGGARAAVSMRGKSGSTNITRDFGVMWAAAYGLVGAIFLPLIPFIGCVFITGGILITLAGIGIASQIRDYTTFKQSATKMRNQLVEQLKQAKLPKECIDPIIADLNAVTELIQSDQSPEAMTPVLLRFVDMFRRGKMDARSSREYTDKLEVLVSNELFVHAARFRAA